jgi:IrrE N-terminal-like domain
VLVYDVMDTEGRELPRDVFAFPAEGAMTAERLASFGSRVSRKNIECRWVDAGDKNAGRICLLKRASGEKDPSLYGMHLNRNHKPPVQFTTLAHELGHLFLGHLGQDKRLNVPDRRDCHHDQREIEAESVAYIVCRRNGVTPASETYLANYVRDNMTVNDIDVYQVMRAASQVEALLGLAEHSKFEKPDSGRRDPARRS